MTEYATKEAGRYISGPRRSGMSGMTFSPIILSQSGAKVYVIDTGSSFKVLRNELRTKRPTKPWYRQFDKHSR